MLFNQILNPRLVSPLVRAFGMKTGQNPAPTLAPEVQPTFDTNQQDDAAQYFLRRSRLFGVRTSVGAVVGQNAEIQIRNPVNSGVLLVIRKLAMFSGSYCAYGTRVTSSDYGTIVTDGAIFDTRWLLIGGTSPRTAIVSSQTNALPFFFSGGYIFANDIGERDVSIVIAPGTSFNALANTANQALFFSCSWEERPVAAEELQTG